MKASMRCCRVAMHFTGPPIKLRASFLKRWASYQLVSPSRPPLWPTEVLSVLQLFSNSPSLGLIGRPGLLGILSRFLCLLEPRFSLIAFLRMVRQTPPPCFGAGDDSIGH